MNCWHVCCRVAFLRQPFIAPHWAPNCVTHTSVPGSTHIFFMGGFKSRFRLIRRKKNTHNRTSRTQIFIPILKLQNSDANETRSNRCLMRNIGAIKGWRRNTTLQLTCQQFVSSRNIKSVKPPSIKPSRQMVTIVFDIFSLTQKESWTALDIWIGNNKNQHVIQVMS